MNPRCQPADHRLVVMVAVKDVYVPIAQQAHYPPDRARQRAARVATEDPTWAAA
jgi:hypothetical protein